MNQIIKYEKILGQEESKFIELYFNNSMRDNNFKDNDIFTNSGVHYYREITERKLKYIKYVGLTTNEFNKLKDNSELFIKIMKSFLPNPKISFDNMPKLKTLFIYYDLFLDIFANDNQFNFLNILPLNLEVLIITLPYYIDIQNKIYENLYNLPKNLKYLVFLIPHEKDEYLNTLKNIKIPLNCRICYTNYSGNIPNFDYFILI